MTIEGQVCAIVRSPRFSRLLFLTLHTYIYLLLYIFADVNISFAYVFNVTSPAL